MVKGLQHCRFKSRIRDPKLVSTLASALPGAPTVQFLFIGHAVQGGQAAPPGRVAGILHQGPGACLAPAFCEAEGRSHAHVHSWRPPPAPCAQLGRVPGT